MGDIEADDVHQLISAITELRLPARQRRLIDAILKVAGDVEDPDVRAFSAEFREAFSKKQADLVLEYAEAAENTGSAVPGGYPVAQPARILRQPPPPPGIIGRGGESVRDATP